MTNKQIRQQASAVYRRHIPLLLLVELILYVSSAIIAALQQVAPNPWRELGRIVALILWYPLRLGSFALYYSLFQNRTASLPDLFRNFRERGLLISALLLGAIMQGINLAFQYIPMLFNLLPAHPAVQALLTLPRLALMILQFWFLFRTFLVQYYFLMEPAAKPTQHIRSSSYTMKGHVFELLALQLPLLGIVIIAVLVLVLVLRAVGFPVALFGTAPFMLLMLPFSPLLGLYTAGFALRLKPLATGCK